MDLSLLINMVYKRYYFLFLYFVTSSEYLIVLRDTSEQETVVDIPIIVVCGPVPLSCARAEGPRVPVMFSQSVSVCL